MWMPPGKNKGAGEELAYGKVYNTGIMALLYKGQHKHCYTVSDHLHLSSEALSLFTHT